MVVWSLDGGASLGEASKRRVLGLVHVDLVAEEIANVADAVPSSARR